MTPPAAATISGIISAKLPNRRICRRNWLGIVMVLAVLTALYLTITADLVADWWNNPNYSHGFLVPLFSGLLIWQRRTQLCSVSSHGAWAGLPVLFAGVSVLVLGTIGGDEFLMRSSFVIVLAGLILFHFGQAILRLIAFPLGFLLFMIPLPQILFNAITFPLQTVAASTAAHVLDALGVAVFLDGHVIQLSQVTLGVTEACSGIRSLISLLALALAWSFLTIRGFWQPIVFVAAVVPITILANANRVIATGLIGEWFGVEYAESFYHDIAGWGIFVLALLCLYTLDLVLRRTAASEKPR